jgi:methyl-accepting chemotaxis protein-1 (serine sensor receptor)
LRTATALTQAIWVLISVLIAVLVVIVAVWLGIKQALISH